jgi:hypothetical protein
METGNSTARQRAAVMKSLTHATLWEATREREEGGGLGEGRRTKEVEGSGQVEERAPKIVGFCCVLLLP